MIARGRSLSVLAVLAVGAIGVISSTQTWLVAVLIDGTHRELAVSGAAAVPVLSPLSLAVLALGAALSIVGLVLRYVFAALSIAIAVLLGWLSAQAAFSTPVSAVASTITAATGITGADAVDSLIESISVTPWPAVTLALCVVLLCVGVFVLITARSWRGNGRKYRSDAAAHASGGAHAPEHAPAAASRPFDAIDSWDDLSRGSDPTVEPRIEPTADPTAGPR